MRNTNCEINFFQCIFFPKVVPFETDWPKQVQNFTEVTH